MKTLKISEQFVIAVPGAGFQFLLSALLPKAGRTSIHNEYIIDDWENIFWDWAGIYTEDPESITTIMNGLKDEIENCNDHYLYGVGHNPPTVLHNLCDLHINELIFIDHFSACKFVKLLSIIKNDMKSIFHKSDGNMYWYISHIVNESKKLHYLDKPGQLIHNTMRILTECPQPYFSPQSKAAIDFAIHLAMSDTLANRESYLKWIQKSVRQKLQQFTNQPKFDEQIVELSTCCQSINRIKYEDLFFDLKIPSFLEKHLTPSQIKSYSEKNIKLVYEFVSDIGGDIKTEMEPLLDSYLNRLNNSLVQR